MPKVSKINVVDFNDNSIIEEEPQIKTDSEEVSAIKEEIKNEANERTEPVKMKTKAKAKPKNKKEEVVEEEVKEEVKEEVSLKAKKEIKYVKCPRCGKSLTEKGLRYSHKCPFDKVLKEPVPVPEPVKEPVMQNASELKFSTLPVKETVNKIKKPVVKKEKPAYDEIPEEIIQQEIQRRMQNTRTARAEMRRESMKKLVSKMF